MARRYSHIVIGAGAVGSAAAYWLSQHGARDVLVLDRYSLVNTMGSSGDHSRIIRHAYHSEQYTALTRAMFAAWEEIEARSSLKLYLRTGGLSLAHAGTAGHEVVLATRTALDAQDLAYEDLSAGELRSRYPQWRLDDDVVGVFQEAGGLLDIRKSVSAHTSLALGEGVEFRAHTPVTRIELRPDSVAVQTESGWVEAGRLIVTVGSWLPELLADLGLGFSMDLSQEQVSYFASAGLRDFAPERFPVWVYYGAQDGDFYGFPVYGEAAVKLGRDMRGHLIRSEDRAFEGDDEEAAVLSAFLGRHLPDARGPVLANRTCVYDLPPDRDFILDTLPDHPHVAVFSGGGHAGKFAGLVGQILADLSTSGHTQHPIAPFRFDRPALTDPDFQPLYRVTRRDGKLAGAGPPEQRR